MNNYWFTNYRASQGGEFVFRYFISSGRELGAEALARFDSETRSPLVVYPYYDSANIDFSRREARLPMAQGSFFKVSGDNVQLAAFKPAEDGNGWIVRLRETAGRAGTARLEGFAFPMSGAYLANGVEANIQPLATNAGSVEAPLKAYQYTTVRLVGGSRP
jgi:alpha-mannosidase